MDDDESLRSTNVSLDAPRENSRANPYNLLMRQSKKMGRFATRTYDVTKEFLKKDIPQRRPANPDRVLFGRTDVSDEEAENKAEVGRIENDRIEKRQQGEQRAKNQIKDIVHRSHEILAVARTVILPVNVFPDTLTVDRTKITINKRTFIWSSEVVSIRIEDILNVACTVGPLFGSLTISSRVLNSTDHFEINYFWRKDAIYMKQIIQGYYIAQHNEIETQNLTRDDLITTLLELGSDSGF